MEKSQFCSIYMCCSIKMMRKSNKSVKLSSILFVYIATKSSAKCHLQTIVRRQVAWKNLAQSCIYCQNNSRPMVVNCKFRVSQLQMMDLNHWIEYYTLEFSGSEETTYFDLKCVIFLKFFHLLLVPNTGQLLFSQHKLDSARHSWVFFPGICSEW